MAEIVVSGYPRSGNTLTSWLLGDILNCPVGGMYAAKPLATEGRGRPKHNHVYQLHLRPEWEGDYSKAVPNAWCLYVPLWSEDEYKICHVVRDPRDIAVSVWHYWKRDCLQTALECMLYGKSPLKVHLPWSEHVERWLRVGVPFVHYEDLLSDAETTLRTLLDNWQLPYDETRIPGAIERQSFASKKAQIEHDSRKRPYHLGIYRLHLRKGIAGDWAEHFTPEQQAQAREGFGDIAAQLGYNL